ncbi:MAG: zinc metallopeptidase [Bacteroidales bacterium]|nr:zinc metallopeptidase [Bacteroidales bacterium]
MGIGYLLIFGIFMILSLIVGERLKSKFRKYSKMPINYGFTGKEVAEKMLAENGIYDVKVLSVQGQLSDHYNPQTKTVNLSPDVYHGQSVAAAAVASHECGHAIQHANAYSMLQLRSALVPIQNISAKIMNFIFIAMFFGVFAVKGLFSIETALLIIIACYGIFTLFAFITLPVEIDASRRALAWLSNAGVTRYDTHDKAKDALKWAAYTYVVAALSSLAMLLYFIAMFAGRRD